MSPDQTVFVVDDDKDARDSVCALVRSMNVRAESFSSAEAFLTAYDQSRSGCLVTDFRMLGMSGIDLLVQLKQAGHSLPVIIISGYVNVSSAVRAMKQGATNVLTKPYEQQDLWDTISTALNQDAMIRADQAARKSITERFERLTSNEHQVLNLVTKGTANKVIARRLDISVRTVEDRRKKIYGKLNVGCVAALVELVVDHKHGATELGQTTLTNVARLD